MTMRITLSGKTYSAAIEVSDVPREEAWPEPTERRVGRGYQYVYDVTIEQAELIVSHVELIGECFVVGDDDYTRAEGRACLRDATRIRKQIIHDDAEPTPDGVYWFEDGEEANV